MSWQYHLLRAEIWLVIQVQAVVKRTKDDAEGLLEIFNLGDKITLQKGERHRLIGLDDYVVIGWIFQHKDSAHPSVQEDIILLQDDFGKSI